MHREDAARRGCQGPQEQPRTPCTGASTDRAVPVVLNDLQRVFAVLQCTMINVPITVTVAFENEIRVT